MPDEQDIEKTLRDYAARRRGQGGPGPEMHPATRRLLQAEVAKLAREAEPGRGWNLNWLWTSRGRMVMGLAVVAALAVVAGIFIGQLGSHKGAGGDREFAKNNTPPAAAANPVLPQPVVKDGSPAEGASTPRMQNAAPAAAPTVAPQPELAANRPEAPASPPAAAASTLSLRAAPMASSELADSTGALLKSAEKATALPGEVTNRYRRLGQLAGARGGNNSLPANLLSSFRVERTAEQLRIVDESDGSVYTGTMSNLAPVAVARLAQFASGVGQSNGPGAPMSLNAEATDLALATNYSFSVSGTNVTLNQLVVMSGTVGPAGFGAGRGAPGGGGRGGAAFGGGGGGGGFGGGGGGGGGLGGAAPAPGGGFGGAPAATVGDSTNQGTPTTNSIVSTAGLVARGGRGGGRVGGAAPIQFRGTVTIGTNRLQINAVPNGP